MFWALITYLIFLSNPNGNRQIYNFIHENSWRICIPLFILSLCSIFVGFLTKDLFIGFGTNFWNNAIFVRPDNYFLLDIEFISFFIMFSLFKFNIMFTLLKVKINSDYVKYLIKYQ